ncbi:hypothetical protein (DUF1963) [Novosphingobium sp. AP12]|nr:hypothetical protein (DUF1963) [Novosphingobium sp. AP12]
MSRRARGPAGFSPARLGLTLRFKTETRKGARRKGKTDVAGPGMKRVIAALAGFALPAIVAAYLKLAPLGGSLAPLDVLASRIIAIQGRDIAVLALLGLGVILAALAALVFGQSGTKQRRIGTEPLIEPMATWTPEPLAGDAMPGDRIAGLRRRALPDEEPAPAPVEAEPAAPPPPVILIRKPREPGRDWFSDASWLGGLPKLGDAPWPRDAGGVPVPFAAQIDLADLAFAAPGAALPTSGSLAFFLGSGAVIAVPDGEHGFAEPPADLPPAFDEGGQPFPATPGRLSRWFFPFWPVELTPLDLPENLRHHGDLLRETAIEEAMASQLQRVAPLRDHPFYAAGVGAPVEALWWHSVIHLTDQLHEALAACARPIAMQRAALEQKLGALAQLEANPAATADAVEHARQTADYLAEELEETEAQCAALPDMVEALEGFIAGRDPWTQLSPEELDVVADLLSEVHERFGELVRHHVPGSLAQLATLSVRAMVSGPPEALAALPGDVLERINADYRLPPIDQHQIFGLPARRAARSEHDGDILLLQLGYDDMMEWCWAEGGLYQFRIAPQDAAAGNWSAASLTFRDS